MICSGWVFAIFLKIKWQKEGSGHQDELERIHISRKPLISIGYIRSTKRYCRLKPIPLGSKIMVAVPALRSAICIGPISTRAHLLYSRLGGEVRPRRIDRPGMHIGGAETLKCWPLHEVLGGSLCAKPSDQNHDSWSRKQCYWYTSSRSVRSTKLELHRSEVTLAVP